MYNKIITIGNLTRNIEIKYLPNGTALAKGSIATSYKYKIQNGEQKEEVCFLDFTIFGKIAEIANQYLHKGSKVMLDGRLQLDQWIDSQTGVKRSKHSMIVNELKVLGDKSDNQLSNNTPIQSQQNQPINIQHNKPTIQVGEIPDFDSPIKEINPFDEKDCPF